MILLFNKFVILQKKVLWILESALDCAIYFILLVKKSMFY